jgi:hypothetical protein
VLLQIIVDISADGSTLAIGSEFSVLALKWNGTHYKQHLNSISFDDWITVSAISLSRDGNAMAVGHPLSGGGVTTVYKAWLQRCTGNMKLVRISFTTDDKPDQNRWSLQIGNETIQSHDYSWLWFKTFVKEICVPNDVCVKFRVFDSGGDGIQDPGGYSVMLDGEEVANGDNFQFKEGGDFKFGETKYINGDCDCPAGLTRLSIVAKNISGSDIPMEWALSHQNTTLTEEYVFNRTMDHDVEIFEECIPKGCWHLTNPQCHAGALATFYNDDYYFNDNGFDWWYNITYKGGSEAKRGNGNFCPEGDETISFGECLPEEKIAVNYRTASPIASISPSSSRFCTGNTPDWVDRLGSGCGLYEEIDLPGCPFFGNNPVWIGDMGSASENCCYCLLSNNPMPSPSNTTLASPTTSTSQTMPPNILTKLDELTTENNENGTN